MHSTERHHRHETQFVSFDSSRCEACWDCIEACPKGVLGRLDLGFHRHVRLIDAQACNGCKKCVRACKSGALTYTYLPPARASASRSAEQAVPEPWKPIR